MVFQEVNGRGGLSLRNAERLCYTLGLWLVIEEVVPEPRWFREGE